MPASRRGQRERRALRGALPRAALTAACALLAYAAPARAEVAQAGGVRLSVSGRLAPKTLPRVGRAPVAVAIGGRIFPTEQGDLPQLRRIEIAINANGRLQTRGVPRCMRAQIEPSSSTAALAICRAALVGSGSFSSEVRLPESSPFPSRGKILAFNGRWHGAPAILAHIYGTDPAPTSYVLPFVIRPTEGTYGTVLEARLPPLTGDWGFVNGLQLTLGAGHTAPGSRYYLTAGCPAPPGFASAPFPLARASFAFSGGVRVGTVLERGCRVRG